MSRRKRAIKGRTKGHPGPGPSRCTCPSAAVRGPK